MIPRLALLAISFVAQSLWMSAQRDFFELAPIKYSDTKSTDAMARLSADWEAGRKPLPKGEPLEMLRTLLKQLEIPEESQVLVYSRTSQQNNLIRYYNPRAIYHSADTSVGYVPGGSIEVASTDPVIGPVFYLLNKTRMGRADLAVRDNTCLQCHGTSRTDLVPGLMVRSVFPDKNGHPILSAGTYLTTDASPIKERWGGWFVTGTHGNFRHMGNTIAEQLDEGGARFDFETGANWESLKGKIDTTKYLRATSDIVSLLILEHQCQTQNTLTKAAMEYRRLVYLQKAIDPEVDVTKSEGMASRSATDSAKEIVRAFLYCNEMDLGDGVEGDPAFVEAFEKGGRKDRKGNSMRQLRLYGRIFKNRCSYLIHSVAFASLPPVVRRKTLEELWGALNGNEKEFAHLGARERERIVAILRETVKDLPKCWEGEVRKEQ